MRFRHLLVAVAALVPASLAAHADPITYNLSLALGGATAYGTITTDGRVGVLSQADITGYTITETAGGASETFSLSPGSLDLVGNDLTATTAGLFFNFSDPTGVQGLELSDSSGNSGVCFENAGSACNANNSPNVNGPGEQIFLNQTVAGSSTITGNAEIAAVTPEPSSFALLGTGLLGLAGLLKRRIA